MVFQGFVLATAITILPITTFAQNNRLNQLSQQKNNSFELRIDNTMTDAQLKQDETDAKKFDFEVSFSGVKRNDKNQITAIKIAYKDQDGNSGNYNVSDETPIKPISIKKQFDGTGKGLINIQSGASQNDLFANGFDMKKFNGMLNNDLFMNLDNNVIRGFVDGNSIDLEKFKKLQGEFQSDSLGGNFKSFIFKDGEVIGDNPDMQLEEEKIDENGTVTKKYSDGKGSTMIFSERNFSSNGDKTDDLEKFKKENKIQIQKNFQLKEDSTKSDLEKLKQELEKTKTDLEKLKSDLEKDKVKSKK